MNFSANKEQDEEEQGEERIGGILFGLLPEQPKNQNDTTLQLYYSPPRNSSINKRLILIAPHRRPYALRMRTKGI
jgi:hypothetical protein